jgi:trk system potassium uptake protein TrkA
MKNKPRSVAVIGLGTFGSAVATALTQYGNPVLGIDTDESAVVEIADTLDEAVIADARNEKALREAGVGHCNIAVIAIGEDLEANIVCTMNVKQIGVSVIWVKAMSRTHHRILSRLGVDRIIHAEREMGQRVAEMLHNPMIHDYVSIGNDSYVVSMKVSKSLADKSLQTLELQGNFRLHCLEVLRGNECLLRSHADPTLQENDRLLLLGRRADLRTFSDDF